MQDWILIRVYLIINHEKQIDFTLKETDGCYLPCSLRNYFLFIDFHFFYFFFICKRLT